MRPRKLPVQRVLNDALILVGPLNEVAKQKDDAVAREYYELLSKCWPHLFVDCTRAGGSFNRPNRVGPETLSASQVPFPDRS